jgi:V8-like Glu-specific endopeptidase
MHWTTGLLAELAEVLAGLYPDVPDSRRVLVEAGVDTKLIDFDAKAFINWLIIVNVLKPQVDTILQKALKEFRDNADLIRIMGQASGTVRVRQKEGQRPTHQLETIIGRHTSMVPIWYFQVAMERSRAVGLLRRGEHGVATGFLTHDNLVITADHVIADKKTAAQMELVMNYEQSTQGNGSEEEVFKLLPKEFFRTAQVDGVLEGLELGVTAVKVAGNPNPRWGALNLQGGHTTENEIVTMVQHPFGAYKSASSGVIKSQTAVALTYDCDTVPGSSGAPVFDHNWNVLAMTVAGRVGSKEGYGIRIEACRQALGL